MSRVDDLVIGTKIRNRFTAIAKKPGDSQIVVALVLIAVAVGLCIIFRDQINDIMQSLFKTIGESIKALAGEFGTGTGTTP